jgi:hypothetical protein
MSRADPLRIADYLRHNQQDLPGLRAKITSLS